MKLNLKISNKHSILIAFIAIALVAANLFGITGLRTLATILVFFFLPFYLILRNFSFQSDEKIFFAFFIGLGFFSTIVFYVGRLIPSYRLSAVIAFIGLLLVPFILRKIKK